MRRDQSVSGEDGPPRSAAAGTHERIAAIVLALPHPGRTLDLPCGHGALAQRLLEGGCDLTVADLHSEEYHLDRPAPVRADLRARLPWGDASFDTVVCCEGLSELDDPYRAVREFARILRPGGTLIASLPNIQNLRSRLRFLLSGTYNKFKLPLDDLRGEATHRPIPIIELRYLLHRGGFRIDRAVCNRIKAADWLTAPLAPIVWLTTRLAFALASSRPTRRRVTREALPMLTSMHVLLGETLIVLARRD